MPKPFPPRHEYSHLHKRDGSFCVLCRRDYGSPRTTLRLVGCEITTRWLKGNVIANEWLYINMSNCIWFSKTAGCKGLKTL